MKRLAEPAVALLAVVTLLGAYLALGGGRYAPSPVADPCAERTLDPDGDPGQQVALSALDGAACRLQVTREDLALALASDSERERFQAEFDVGDEEFAEAVRAGLQRAIDDAESLDTISPTVADVSGAVLERLPLDLLTGLLERVTGEDDPIAALNEGIVAGVGAVDSIGDLLDDARELIPEP